MSGRGVAPRRAWVAAAAAALVAGAAWAQEPEARRPAAEGEAPPPALTLEAAERALPAWAARVDGVRDGLVRLSFATRPGVCVSGSWRSEGCPCEPLVVARLARSDGRAVRLDLRGPWATERRERGDAARANPPAADLGEVPPVEAAAFFLLLARDAGEDVGEAALAASSMADGVEVWPALIELVRRPSLPSGTRKAAVFWAGQAAADRATEGLVGLLQDEVELSLREHAIFALSQREDAASLDALLRVARESPEPRLRKRALFWLSQRPEPRVIAFFEEILVGG